MFLFGQVSRHVENYNIARFLDTMIVIDVILYMMVLLIELYLFISLSVTLTIFQDHRNNFN